MHAPAGSPDRSTTGCRRRRSLWRSGSAPRSRTSPDRPSPGRGTRPRPRGRGGGASGGEGARARPAAGGGALGRRLAAQIKPPPQPAAEETSFLREIVGELVVPQLGPARLDGFARLPERVVLVAPPADRADDAA